MPLIPNFLPKQYSIRHDTLVNTPYNLPRGVLEKLTDKFAYLIALGNEGAALIIQEILGQSLIENVKNNDYMLIITYALEPLVGVEEIVYKKLIVDNNINENKIILLTSRIDAGKIINELSIKLNKQPIRAYYFSTFEFQIQQATKVAPIVNLKKYKKFICLNRRWRLHRPFLVAMLSYYGLLKHGYVSLGKCEKNSNWNISIQQILNYHKKYPFEETLKIVEENKESFNEIPDLYLDTNDLDINRPNIDDSIKVFFQTSYFSVVTETLFFSNTQFLSEKIFKPIAMKHPFILVGTPNLLSHIILLGYKTFHPYINEEYDKETNHCKRMKLIVDEIKRLSELSDSDWQYLNQKLQPIIDYNFSLLKSKINLTDFIHPLI